MKDEHVKLHINTSTSQVLPTKCWPPSLDGQHKLVAWPREDQTGSQVDIPAMDIAPQPLDGSTKERNKENEKKLFIAFSRRSFLNDQSQRFKRKAKVEEAGLLVVTNTILLLVVWKPSQLFSCVRSQVVQYGG